MNTKTRVGIAVAKNYPQALQGAGGAVVPTAGPR